MATAGQLAGRPLVAGEGKGPVMHADTGLSFWGGVDPTSGRVIDQHHPLFGRTVAGAVLAIPSGRGSCTGSQVMLELLLNGKAPAAVVLSQPDEILALGVIVAEELFGRSIPVVTLAPDDFDAMATAGEAQVAGGSLALDGAVLGPADEGPGLPELELTAEDQQLLDGARGEAAALAMRIVVRVGRVQGAERLVPISQAHIDGCTYIGPGGLRFAELLVELGGKVAVPTTLNSISVDRAQWRKLGVPAERGEPSAALGEAYLALGATPSFTCAPYLLESKPRLGEQIAWVLGARTQKYADYLDICAALTGRTPLAGCHLPEYREATVRLDASLLEPASGHPSFWPVFGYLCGLAATGKLPLVTGVEQLRPSMDQLKAFSAAFGTTGTAAMFHMEGVTPEASSAAPEGTSSVSLTLDELERVWGQLDGGGPAVDPEPVQLVALGNPHLSLTEFEMLAQLCEEGESHPSVSIVATASRTITEQAAARGFLGPIERFGVRVVNDTCWCMLTEPVVPPHSTTLITNSAKYAHYAPGLMDRRVRFGSMAGCVDAARTGVAQRRQGRPWARGIHTAASTSGLVARGARVAVRFASVLSRFKIR